MENPVSFDMATGEIRYKNGERFHIGQQVSVWGCLEKVNEGVRRRRVEQLIKPGPRHGWVVGVRNLLLDWEVDAELTERSSLDYMCPEGDGSPYVSSIADAQWCLSVSFWPTLKPVDCLLGSVNNGTIAPFLPVPTRPVKRVLRLSNGSE